MLRNARNHGGRGWKQFPFKVRQHNEEYCESADAIKACDIRKLGLRRKLHVRRHGVGLTLQRCGDRHRAEASTAVDPIALSGVASLHFAAKWIIESGERPAGILDDPYVDHRRDVRRDRVRRT